ncbi:MAG: hypothetical protein ACLQT6_04980 [Desulfomonilaceae bacterium]
MGAIAKEFVSRTLMLVLFLSFGYLALPVSLVAQSSREAVIQEQYLKKATYVLQQRQRAAAPAQDQGKLRQRLAREFAALVVEAKAQHAMIEQWRKAHSKEPDWESLNR